MKRIKPFFFFFGSAFTAAFAETAVGMTVNAFFQFYGFSNQLLEAVEKNIKKKSTTTFRKDGLRFSFYQYV